MDRFRKILVSVDVAVDSTPACLERAVRLSKDTRAELHIVDVVKELPPFLRKLFHGPTDGEEIEAAERSTRLKKLCRPLEREGIKFSSKVLTGRPFVEIIAELERRQCDLLMRNAPDPRFGSLEMRLLRNCPRPVWIVNGRFKPYFQRVLAAIDPLPGDEKEERLNEQILDLAYSLAKWEDASLHVVAIWEIRGEPLLISKMNERAFSDHGAEVERSGQAYLRGLLKQLPTPLSESQITYKKGDPARGIRENANEIDADVIVMGSLARTGIPGLLMGNTAESVLKKTKRSVLTIKAAGFTSPVAT